MNSTKIEQIDGPDPRFLYFRLTARRMAGGKVARIGKNRAELVETFSRPMDQAVGMSAAINDACISLEARLDANNKALEEVAALGIPDKRVRK